MREAEEFAFRAYVAESLRLRAEGKAIASKWTDIVRPTAKADPEKSVAGVLSRAGLVVV